MVDLVAQLSCPTVEALFLPRSFLLRVLGFGLLHGLSHPVMIRPGHWIRFVPTRSASFEVALSVAMSVASEPIPRKGSGEAQILTNLFARVAGS